jgi:hypothetical protein
VSGAIEIRVSGNGRFQARRRDGLPLTDQDKAEARRIALEEKQKPDPTNGKIIAVKVCSHVLEACIWLSFDPDFKPDKDEALAVFYAHEIPFLSEKTIDELREIHQWKLTFGPRTQVNQ